MTPKRGLPERARMRHDAHFVDELARRSSSQIGAMLPLSIIEPNPGQPRTNVGNLEDLTASIREKGVLEPILVRQIGPSRYQIISGERRFRAATAAGLDEIPAIELDASDREVVEIALIENIQRKDLTAFEEAEGFQFLQEKFGYTHEKISQVIGKSRTTITETLQLNEIPDRIRVLCREAGISNKSVLVQIARAGSEEEMEMLVERFGRGEIGRAEVRKATSRKPEVKKAGRPKHYSYDLHDKSLPFTLSLKFRKAEVEREEVISALRAVLERLESER
ncbi:MAG TPA: ParB/RepB/Spo0J family partition protein [Thermoanaerobaculia bacterium]|nr:ParB/RepB/Spo0J family partition protein [Thermoanaerobaculia bacterium]